MNLIEKRKAELREYIEARAKATKGEWEFNASLYTDARIWIKEKDCALFIKAEKPMYGTLKENADFIALAANESARIAEQLLECIEVLEKYKNSRSFVYCDPVNIYREIYLAEDLLNKISGEK